MFRKLYRNAILIFFVVLCMCCSSPSYANTKETVTNNISIWNEITNFFSVFFHFNQNLAPPNNTISSIHIPYLQQKVLGNSTKVLNTENNISTSDINAEGSLLALAAGQNLLSNSSFEIASSGQPAGWQYLLDSTTVNTFVSPEGIHSGREGLKFLGGGSGNFGIKQSNDETTPGRTYTFSGFIKMVNVPEITVRLGFWDQYNNKEGKLQTFHFSNTKDWSRISITITTPGIITDTANYYPLIEVEGLRSGSLYLDDMLLTEGSVLSVYDSAVAYNTLPVGTGAIVSNVGGDIMPILSGMGNLGTTTNKFLSLNLANASIDSQGNLNLSGNASISGSLSLSGLITNGILYANGATLTSLLPGASGYVLQSNGVTSAPSWVPNGNATTGIFNTLSVGIGKPFTIGSDGITALTYSGNAGTGSQQGAIFLNNTNNTGNGLTIYSNQGANGQGQLLNLQAVNRNFTLAAFHEDYYGTGNAFEITNNSNDISSNALAVTGNNLNDSTLGIIGYELGKGTIKVSHYRSGSLDDSNASGISIDLKGVGTRAQGLYVNSTETGGTLGDLLRLRNQSIDEFVVDYQGNLTQGGYGMNTTYTKYGNTTGDQFFVGTNGAFRIQRATGNSEAFRVQINGDTQGRWRGTSDGSLQWGNGSTAQDVILQRSSPGILTLQGGLTFNNTNAAYDSDFKGMTDNNLLYINATSNQIGIGTSVPNAPLDIEKNGIGNAAFIADQLGSGDIFTASSSGNSKFTISNSGNLTLAGQTTFNGQTYTWPISQNANYILQTNGSGVLSWVAQSLGSNYWQLNNGILSPATISNTLTIGQTAGLANAGLDVEKNALGNATFIADQLGSGDIFTASSSGSPKFVVTNNGYVAIGTNAAPYPLTVAGGDIQLDNGSSLRIKNNAGSASPVLTYSASNNLQLYNTASTGLVQIGINNSSNTSDLRFFTAGNVERMRITNTGTIGINVSVPPLATLDVRGISGTMPVASISGATSKASLLVNNDGTGDLFTASSSGATKVAIDTNGNLTVNGDILANSGNLRTSASTFNLVNNTPTIINFGGVATVINIGSNTGTTTINNNIAVAGQTTFNGQTYTWPVSQNANYVLQTNGSGVLSWVAQTGGATNYWQLNNGVLSPATISNTLAIGQTTGLANAGLDVEVNALGNATAVINQKGSGDIFTASASGVSKFVINQNGNIGIGTTNPQGILDITDTHASGFGGIDFISQDSVSGTSAPIIMSHKTGSGGSLSVLGLNVYNNNAGATGVYNTANGGWGLLSDSRNNSTPSLQFTSYTAGNVAKNAMTLLQGGNVGIGTATPTTALDIVGSASTSGNLTFRGGGAQQVNLLNNSTLGFYNSVGGDAGLGSNPSLFLSSSGNVGIGTTTPIDALQISGGGITLDNAQGYKIKNSLGAVQNVLFLTSGNSLQLLNSTSSGQLQLGINNASNTSAIIFGTKNNIERMRIDQNGNVGINTTAPVFKLDTVDTQNATSAASITNLSTSDTANTGVLSLNLGTATSGTNARFIQFYAGANTQRNAIGVGRIQLNNGNVAYNTGGADFAEYFSKGEIPLSQGDIVTIDKNSQAVPATKETGAIGVISSTAGFIGNAPHDESQEQSKVIVGLVGQLPVKVTTENGPIQPGDLLTFSATPGVAMKATQSGITIGRSLEGYTNADTHVIGKITVLVNLSWNGQVISLNASQSAQQSFIPQIAPVNDSLLSLQAEVSSISAQIQHLDLISSIQSQLSGPIITDTLTVSHKTVLSDVGITGTESMGLLKINGMDTASGNTATINTLSGPLRLQNLALGGVDILSGKILIDTEGNMKSLGTITAKEVTTDRLSITRNDSTTASIGKAILPKGKTSIVIETKTVHTDSSIFLTPNTLVTEPLSVTSQTEGIAFTVSIAKPFTHDVYFNWWIIN